MKDVLERYAAKTRTSLSIVAVIVMILAGLSDFAQDGQSMEQGYRLWAKTINNNGGLLGRPVQLVILHDNSDPAQVAKNYDTLIHKDHVDLVIGPFSTLLTKAAEPVVSKAKYALIEGAGGGNSVFTNEWTNVFDVSLPVANNLTTFAYYILSLPASQRPKTVAYATSDDPFTQPQLVVAEQLLQSAGVTTVFDNTGLTSNTNQPYPEADPHYLTKFIP